MGSDEVDPELDAVCRAEHPRLVGLVALYVGDVQVAEDLAQEALVRLHLHWPRVREARSVHAWLSTVAMNLARSWWRRRFAELRANTRSAARPADDAGPPDRADVLAVRAAVAGLPPRHRAVVVLRFYAGLSVAETAEALRCPEGTVKSLTHHAVARLRRTVDADLAEELARA